VLLLSKLATSAPSRIAALLCSAHQISEHGDPTMIGLRTLVMSRRGNASGWLHNADVPFPASQGAGVGGEIGWIS
jgi:hypothetical protein